MHQARFFAIGRLVALVAIIIVAGFSAPAVAAVPSSTLFEGVLTSVGGGPVADGPYQLTFGLYPTAQGGSAAWVEGPVEVTVTSGRFAVRLGTTKPLSASALAAMPTAWLGVKVGNDPELPRQALASVPYALVAAHAESVACKDCVSAQAVGFAYAGSSTKGGPAADLACTGCVSVAELAFDGDVDLGGNSLKAKNGTFSGDVAAKSVTATEFVGDGSKLTGIKTPSGSCSKAGEVVKGIKADGTLDCVSFTGSLPGDGISQVSNGVMSNVFTDVFSAPAKDLPIPDNTGATATSNIDVPDVGLVRDLKIAVKLSNTDLSTVSIKLLPPDDKGTGWTLCDPCGDVDGKALEKTWDSKTLPKVGDPTAWFGKNAKGLWTLKVLDASFCIPQKPGNSGLCNLDSKSDGAVADWSVQIETLSNKKLHDPKGHLWARTASAHEAVLADGKTIEVDTATGLPAVLAQAWIYDKDNKNWVQASTAVDGTGCAGCGSGKDGDYKPTSNANLVGKAYEFKDFIIPKGVTIKVTGSTVLQIKATGKVQIDGVLDLSGAAGASTSQGSNGCSGNTGCAPGGVGVSGGANGAQGCYGSSGQTGGGSGGGKGGTYCSSYGAGGGGGGYGTGGSNGVSGSSGCSVGAGGGTYTGVHAGIAVGGSGGGSGGYGTAYNSGGGGGGAGGGVIRIDATEIRVSGSLIADGGKGGDNTNNCDGGAGGGGSGGGIWLRAAKVDLSGGTVRAVGGAAGDAVAGQSSDGGDGGAGGVGQIRVDSTSAVVGTTNPTYTKGNATDLGTFFNRFRIHQPTPGKIVLTNQSGQTHDAYLVVSY
ncbi:MAG: hypothetical protein H6747_15350 [Deltaproteobacteria bacterium]|nr:hypothetical protein [Deltaproteobacteria bacterium]